MQAAGASVNLAIVSGGRFQICTLLIACLTLLGCVRATFTPISTAQGQLAQVAALRGLLCDGTLCEIGLVLSSPATNARATLESKYGPGHAVPNDAPSCKRSERFTWLWAADGTPTGAITLVDDCEVAVFYDDGRGLAVRERQVRQRLQSF